MTPPGTPRALSCAARPPCPSALDLPRNLPVFFVSAIMLYLLLVVVVVLVLALAALAEQVEQVLLVLLLAAPTPGHPPFVIVSTPLQGHSPSHAARWCY